jgi:hypothetical protein
LPADALSLQRASAGLLPEAKVALQRAESALRGNLAVPLRSMFPATPPGEFPKSEEKEKPP